MRTLILALALVASCVPPRRPEAPRVGAGAASSAARSYASPEGAARVVLEATIAGDYLTVARSTDPAELRRTRAAFDSLLRADSAGYVAQRLFRLGSAAELRRLSDVEFTAGLMRFQLELRGAREYFVAVRGVDVVGTLPQGRDTAHVVYRWRFPPDSLPLRSYQVQTLVRCAAGWCGHMAGDYRELLQLLLK
jgi:hypothetical protein